MIASNLLLLDLGDYGSNLTMLAYKSVANLIKSFTALFEDADKFSRGGKLSRLKTKNEIRKCFTN
jgi:hypothetical protein